MGALVSKVYLLVFAMMMTMWTWQVISYFEFQAEVKKFAAKGPRFTAVDGQALCERIQKLEKKPKPCEYGR